MQAVIFPPLKDIPDFGPNAAKDFKSFVSQARDSVKADSDHGRGE